MSDTFTTNLNLDKPATGAYDIFGAKLNSNLDIIDAASEAIGGVVVSGTPAAGSVIVATGPTAAVWVVFGFPAVASDPVSPVAGQAWLNTTQQQFKAYNGVAVVVLG